MKNELEILRLTVENKSIFFVITEFAINRSNEVFRFTRFVHFIDFHQVFWWGSEQDFVKRRFISAQSPFTGIKQALGIGFRSCLCVDRCVVLLDIGLQHRITMHYGRQMYG